MLLNIVRAAYRRPVQFTDVISVTGQSTVAGGFGSVLPLGGPAEGYQINPSASWSGGPTFNVGTPNNKEFFTGILSPIGMPTIGSYMLQGRPLDVLFSLLLDKIVIKIDGKFTVFRSTGFGEEFDRFQTIANELQDAGLTTQMIFAEQGPMTKKDTISSLQAAGLELAEYPDGKGRVTTRVKTPDSAFCFQQRRPTLRPPSDLRPMIDRLRAALDCDQVPIGSLPEQNPAAAKVEIIVVPRSVMGVIYRLGEISRRELGLDAQADCGAGPADKPCEPPVLVRYYRDRQGNVVKRDTALFVIRNTDVDPTMAVAYNGTTYGIRPDPNAFDHSSEILELTEELLALNSSARDLPSPNLISIH